ncbi:MAG: hypothetical protein HY906_24660 [Deltaproteobacteria bacterium]|nr:hypothetical protein [Deltaproteobacteria bacterium]
MTRLEIRLVALLVVLAAGSCSPAADSADAGADAAADAGVVEIPPILVSAWVHIDPLPPAPMTQAGYGRHRDGMLWYLDLAQRTGARISAQMTGNYAEAAVLQGHETDFADFMPGKSHHLGSHTHAWVHGGSAYSWTELPEAERSDPASVLRVFNDNIGFVNRIFAGNGCTAADNWFFHGSHATYPGMDGPILLNDQTVATTYTNVYRTCGADRSMPAAFRGGCFDGSGQGAADPHGRFVKISEVGGLIGLDQIHGPEGMVYGTVPYERRDFIRVVLEWREAARRNPQAPPLHFNYMVHPTDIESTARLGTDGRPIRTSIEELITWLNQEYVGRRDPAGRLIATWGTVPDIEQRFLAWEASWPEERARLADAVNQRTYGRLLPGLWTALDGAYHDRALSLAGVVAHRFVARATGTVWVLLYSESGTVSVPAGGDLPSDRDLMAGDGSVTEASGPTVSVGEPPVLVAPRGGFSS